MSKRVIWTLKEITGVLRKRQLNNYDANVSISGNRGDGKSTIAFKIFNSFKHDGFKQEKHQVYSQKDVIKLLSLQKFSFCWDDEAINSGYKRDFQHTGQKKLIKIVTNYRDNFNIYASALPFFTSLDKDLRALVFLHIHVIERGLAVIFMPLEHHIFGDDKWDVKRNIEIEKRENKRIEKNPKLKFRYHKFTTFAGYVCFGDMSQKQRKRYEEIKTRKRALSFSIDEDEMVELTFEQKMYKELVEGTLSYEFLEEACRIEKINLFNLRDKFNRMLREQKVGKTFSQLILNKNVRIRGSNKNLESHSNSNDDINGLIPQF